MSGPRVRTDVVDVYIFRRAFSGPGLDFLQLLRARAPMARSWQPIMGHIEDGESAARTALREVGEEVGLGVGDAALRGFWALEQVWPYYLREDDSVVLSPRFAMEVDREWEPVLNEEHVDARWIGWPAHVGEDRAARPSREYFLWPGQGHALAEIAGYVARAGSGAASLLAIDPGSV